MDMKSVSTHTIQRLPKYLSYLKSLPKSQIVNISSTSIADALGLNNVQVRKDLAVVSTGGRPKVGYQVGDLIHDLERFLGYENTTSAVIAGAGNLGRALITYEGFKGYGLDIVAAFDMDENLIGTAVQGRQVFHVSQMKELCRSMNIKIGIIAVPVHAAQMVCDIMVESGILAIWNFSPTHLTVTEEVLVQSENMASSLAILSNHLAEKIFIDQNRKAEK